MKSDSSTVPDLADEILALLEEAYAQASPELRAPSLADSTVWSLIIGFLSSVAGNLFTKGLPNPQRGQLSETDLEEIEAVFNAVAKRQQELKQEAVEAAVQSHLPMYLSAPERRRLTSEIAHAILKACQASRNTA